MQKILNKRYVHKMSLYHLHRYSRQRHNPAVQFKTHLPSCKDIVLWHTMSMHNFEDVVQNVLKINFITTTLQMTKLFNKYVCDIKSRVIKIQKRFGDFVLRHYIDIPNFAFNLLAVLCPKHIYQSIKILRRRNCTISLLIVYIFPWQ